MGAHEPHRPYRVRRGESRAAVPPGLRVPSFLPDTPNVRRDLADYYADVARFDAGVGEALAALEAAGVAGNTLVVVTSDNGMPFPRAKANLYDGGTRVPLAVAWPGHVRPGTRTGAFMDLSDLAPTFLEAAGVPVPREMTGKSLLGVLRGEAGRNQVFLERERHADCRAGHKSYPMRAIRTGEYLYIRNLRADLWPAGDPDEYGDIDGSPSKHEVEALARKGQSRLAQLALAKRPAEELYDIHKDPDQLTNLADDHLYRNAKEHLRAELDAWMESTADPRAHGDDTRWDGYEYFKGRRGAEEDERPATRRKQPH
jgi:N-sulfoglucosamine sulfohydrolase